MESQDNNNSVKLIRKNKKNNIWKQKGFYSSPAIEDKDFFNKIILHDVGERVYNFIKEGVNLESEKAVLLTYKNNTAYENTNGEQANCIINLQPVNKHKNLDHYFSSIYTLLPDGGTYIGCVQSFEVREKYIYKKFKKPFLAKAIIGLDFIFNRVFPKLPLTKEVYSFLLRGNLRVISKTEALGRLCYEGFEIKSLRKINDLEYFTVIKKRKPVISKPSSGLLYKMNRVSINGKVIGVYKIRTMHPYSEYLQKYVVSQNGYNVIGKPKDDFRLTKWGKVIRKMYLDEMPQIINVIKGELNIVGVRPLSKFGFESLPDDLQKERIKYKPGCIPPNVSLGITGFDGVIKAEKIYLRQMRKNGLSTNIKYFASAVYNIVSRKSSSS